MKTQLDLSRWRETPRGVAARRGAIVRGGLTELLGTRFFRFMLAIAWSGGTLVAAFGFVFSQSVASGGWVAQLATHLGARFEAVATALSGLVLLYPDICIRGVFTVLFWLHSYLGLGLSLVALTVIVPRLITRDRATNALIIYLSRPLTSADYLLGKLGIIAGVLVMVWTGPLVLGWLLSVLLAPNSDFIVYSFSPLLRALLFNGISFVVLSSVALGVSAVARSSRTTVIIWVGLWLVLAVFADTGSKPDWARRISFSHDLSEVRLGVFQLDRALADAGSQLPLLDRNLADKLSRDGEKAQADDFGGALWSLGLFCVGSSFVFFRKLRPE